MPLSEIELEQNKKDIAANNVQLAISNENIEQLKYALQELRSLKPDSELLYNGLAILDELRFKQQQEKEAKEKDKAALALEIALQGNNIETLQSAINEYERVNEISKNNYSGVRVYGIFVSVLKGVCFSM